MQAGAKAESKVKEVIKKEILYVMPRVETHLPAESWDTLAKGINKVLNGQSKGVYIMIDLEHMESQQVILKALQEHGISELSLGLISRTKFKIIPAGTHSANIEKTLSIMGRIFNELPSQDTIMVYIGSSEKFVNTLTLNLGTNVPLYTFNPIASDFVEVAPQIVKRKVMQRYGNVEKVRSDETKVIGILIGSVVVDNYMPLINNIKLSAARAGKKYYEVLIGKLNEPKLKNFQFVSSIISN